MKTRNVLQAVLVPIVVLFVLGCPAPGGGGIVGDGGGGTALDPAGAVKLVDEGIALMKIPDWDGALSKFGGAVLKDPNNGRAVIGYAALNLAGIMADPSIVTLAKNKLGLADYPTSMNMVLTPSSWMENNDPKGSLFPRISGEMAYDGQFGGVKDGKIDTSERLYAFAAYFILHNTGFNDLANTVTNTLGARLDAGIAAIKAATDDMSFTLTWDMFFSSPPAQGGPWPYLNGSPATIVIGKAELLGIAAGMEVVRGLTCLAQVYDLTLPLGDYWTAYNPGNGSGTNPSDTLKPFSGTFLKLTADSASKLASARAAYLGAISDLTASADGILSNRPGFSLSRDPITGLFQIVDDWTNFSRVMKIVKKFAAVMQSSITNIQVAYLPVSFTSSFDPDANWPTNIALGSSVGVNFGAYFNTPINLYAAVIDISTGTDPQGEASGEPVYYRWGTSDFVKVDNTYMNGFSNDFRASNPSLCIRIADATFGGTVPTANYPKDDPATKLKFQMYWNDSSTVPTGYWETNEVINNASTEPQIEGVIDCSNSAYSPDPTAYYPKWGPVPDALLDPYLAPGNRTPTYRDSLRAALKALGGHFYQDTSPSFFLKGSSIYAQFLPASLAWNSFAAKNTSGSVSSLNDMTSAGSIWWAGGMQIYNNLKP